MKPLSIDEIKEKLKVNFGATVLNKKNSNKVRIPLKDIKIYDGGKLYEFGDITIGVTLLSSECSIRFVHSSKYTNTVHPHISGESICLGDHDSAIKTMFFFDPVSAVKQIHSILCNYGSRPYTQLSNFDSELILCSCCYRRKRDATTIPELEYTFCSDCAKKYPYHPISDIEKCCKCSEYVHTSFVVLKNKTFMCKECANG